MVGYPDFIHMDFVSFTQAVQNMVIRLLSDMD